MKRIFIFLLITMCIGTAFAQSYSDAFDEAFSRDDITAQREALKLWQREAPEDVNLFIARYNFFANQAMGQNPNQVSASLADSALMAIEDGIAHFPDRLDLRFGKIYFLGELRMWDAFVDEIGRAMDYSVQIDHHWLYPNVPGIADTARLSAADTLVVRQIQGLAKRVVQLFPGDFPNTYMLALSHLILNENDKAYRYLVRAEKLSSTSKPLLWSLVKVCRKLGKAAQAEEYQRRLNSLQQQD